MKFLRRPYWLPLLSLIAGIGGCLLLKQIASSGTDYKGLIAETSPAILYLVILSIAVPVGLAVAVWTLPFKPAPMQVSYVGQSMIAAGIGITFYLKFIPLTPLPMAIGLAAIVSLLLLDRYEHKFSFWFCLAATVFFIALPIIQYRQWSVSTQMLRYFAPLLASLSLVLCCYYRTARSYGQFYGKQFLFFSCCAVFFCALSLTSQMWIFYLTALIWSFLEVMTLFPKRLLVKKMPLPPLVAYCLHQLQTNGYKAFIVGGCVRDRLLGQEPQDYDICTSATPEQIASVFAHCQLILSGEKHGTVGVVLEDQVFEITTFRTEGAYSDCRHPDTVEWSAEIEEDLARRDFTVNAMAYAPLCGLVDPCNGRLDLEDRILQAVGDPRTRFGEDALRILRGVRFASRYHLEVESQTKSAMLSQASLLKNIAAERIFDELSKILPMATAETLLDFASVFTKVIPELASTVGFDQQTPHHAYDVYHHTALVVAATPAEPALRWAALLHDVGKPASFAPDENGQGHFPGHAEKSAAAADEILRRLKAPTALREEVVFLIENHMLSLPADRKILRRRIGKYGASQVVSLLTLQRADFAGKGVSDPARAEELAKAQTLLTQIIEEADCLTLKDLTVNGDDLIALGFAPGKALGDCLQQLFDAIMEERLPNNREYLLEEAKKILESENAE